MFQQTCFLFQPKPCVVVVVVVVAVGVLVVVVVVVLVVLVVLVFCLHSIRTQSDKEPNTGFPRTACQ